MAARRKPIWDATQIRALRQHLGLTQQELAREINTRQQTISEWETGLYQPRGASEKLLSIVAERAGFEYGSVDDEHVHRGGVPKSQYQEKLGVEASSEGKAL